MLFRKASEVVGQAPVLNLGEDATVFDIHIWKYEDCSAKELKNTLVVYRLEHTHWIHQSSFKQAFNCIPEWAKQGFSLEPPHVNSRGCNYCRLCEPPQRVVAFCTITGQSAPNVWPSHILDCQLCSKWPFTLQFVCHLVSISDYPGPLSLITELLLMSTPLLNQWLKTSF